MLVRRGYEHGENFDITVGWNLRSRHDRGHFWKYLEVSKPTIMILSTPCIGMKAFAGINRVNAPEAYRRSRMLSVPLGRVAGDVAYYQIGNGRDFISEHPQVQ